MATMNSGIRFMSLGLVVGGLVLAACIAGNDTTDERSTGATKTGLAAGGAAVTANSVPQTALTFPVSDPNNIRGFRHSLAKSRFAAGNLLNTVVDANQVERTTLAEGVFALFPNGFSAGRPDPSGPSASTRLPMTGDGNIHNEHVKNYFLGAGLPAEQAGAIHANAMMAASGMAGPHGASDVKPTHLGFVSVLDRRVSGVRVEGSYAWAQFNASGDVVAESVWWPELRSTLAAEVAAAEASRSGPTSAAFRGTVPAKFANEPGEVVIHHPGPISPLWYARVTIDFAVRGEGSVSFDSVGAPVIFTNTQAVPDSPR
jgi:hypothetical protein